MRVDGDTPNRKSDPSRLARSDSLDPTGDLLMSKIVACGRAPTIESLEAKIVELEARLKECPLCPGFSTPCGNSHCPQLKRGIT